MIFPFCFQLNIDDLMKRVNAMKKHGKISSPQDSVLECVLIYMYGISFCRKKGQHYQIEMEE